MRNGIVDLRNHLFEVLEGLLDKEDPLPVDRAQAVAEVAQVVVNSAKVEVDFLRVTGGDKGSGFIPTEERKRLGAGGSA